MTINPASSSPTPVDKLPSWLQHLSVQPVIEHYKPEPIEKALLHRFRYALPCHLSKTGELKVTFHNAHHPPVRSFAYIQMLQSKSQVTLTFHQGSRHFELFPMTCSCGPYPCLHQLAALMDLAISPALRVALASGDVHGDAVKSLPLMREKVYRDFVTSRAMHEWAPDKTSAASQSPIYTIDIRDTLQEVEYTTPVVEYEHHPRLEIRPRLPRQRAILTQRQCQELRFPELDQQVFRLVDSNYQRKGFYAIGPDAAAVVHLLRERDVLVEGTGEAMVFSSSPVTLRLAITKMVRNKIGVRNTSSPVPGHALYRTSIADDGAVEPLAKATVPVLEARWTARDGSLDVSSADAILLVGYHPYLYVPARQTVFPLHPAIDINAAWRFFVRPSVELAEGYAPLLYRSLRKGLQGTCISLPSPVDVGLVPAERPRLVARLDGTPLDTRIQLEAEYSIGVFSVAPTASSDIVQGTRDMEAETTALTRLIELGLPYDPAEQAFRAKDDDAVRFWSTGIATLQQQTEPRIALMIPQKLKSTRVRNRLGAKLQIELEGSWFSVNFDVGSEDQRLDPGQLRAIVDAKRRWVVLKDGSLAEITEELRELLEDTLDVLEDRQTKLGTHHIGRLGRWTECADAVVTESAAARAAKARLTALSVATEPPLPAGLRAELRPYQKQGLAWLQFLHELGAGGVLADDMGLGKTLMTLSLLLWRQQQEGSAPSLVVCPTSVAGNWAREATRFAPGLSVLLLNRGEQQIRSNLLNCEAQDMDLVITTYGLLRRDIDVLSTVPFRVVILDEAQCIKNADTATAKAARRLQGQMRLALSGTPVENRLSELWSILEFCNPGMLGKQALFRRRFEQPILADSRCSAARRLKAIVRPFVLRRTKRQVLEDLPPKQEIDLLCQMSPHDKGMYDQLAKIARDEVDQAIAKDGLGRSRIAVLTALLRLRQLACDSRLIDRKSPPSKLGKRAAFLNLVRELCAEGRRALVFSQFVELLTLWRRDLEHEGIAYEYLDGSTVNRDAVVANFQNGDAPLFLISLKAGGTGLNLTAADTVIHCDPWWNPAVEDQATDRAHRMGQDKHVTVFRLVAAGTVEERILLLKARKRQLADAVVDDAATALQGLSEDDVRLLLCDADALTFTEDDDREAEEAKAVSPLGAVEQQVEVAASVVDEADDETVNSIRALIQLWLDESGRKIKDLARHVGLPSGEIQRIWRGTAGPIPRQQAERLWAVLSEKVGGQNIGEIEKLR